MPGRTAPAPEMVIFSDLDGTFLDHHTYSFEPALPAFRRCLASGIPVVFCSSKTRFEIEPLRGRLACTDPFIVENGGAVFIPKEHFPFQFDFHAEIDSYLVIEFGVRYGDLTATLDRLAGRLGVRVRSFHQMTAGQIAQHTELSLEDAALAMRREYDEPFLFVDADGAAVKSFLAAVERRGLHWTRGGRFYHLKGHTGKGAVVRALTALYRSWNPDLTTAGLGDSVNDISLLRAVDFPIVVPKRDAGYDPEVRQRVPAARLSPLPGPWGWNTSVQDLLAAFSKRSHGTVPG